MKRVLKVVCLVALLLFGAAVHAAQPDLIKLTVGYTPITAATLPFFIALEEKLFQKHGLEVVPVFFGGTPLIVSAMHGRRISHRSDRRCGDYLQPAGRQ